MTIDNKLESWNSKFNKWVDNYNKEVIHGQHNPTNNLARKIDLYEKNGAWFKSRFSNIGLVGLNVFFIASNVTGIALTILLIPIRIPLNFGARVLKFAILKTRVDLPGATFRRSILKSLPGFIEESKTFKIIGIRIKNISILSAGVFTSLATGFISVKANLWLYHKLGLAKITHLTKEDRERAILDHAKKQDHSLEKLQQKKFDKKVKKEAIKLMHQKAYGKNHYETKLEACGKNRDKRLVLNYILDENPKIKKSLEEATIQKRKTTLKELEDNQGKPLDHAKLQYIQNNYWRVNLKEYVLNKFNKYKDSDHWNFNQERFKKHEQEYYKWNLTAEQESEIINQVIEDINDSTNAETAEKNAKKFILNKQKALRQKLLFIEQRCEEFDQRIHKVLSSKNEKYVPEIATSESLQAIYTREKALYKVEEAIAKASDVGCENGILSIDRIEEIIDNQVYSFSDDDKEYLQKFALTALDLLEDRKNKSIQEVDERPLFLAIEDIYKKKNSVIHELICDFSSSKFKQFHPYNTDGSQRNNYSNPKFDVLEKNREKELNTIKGLLFKSDSANPKKEEYTGVKIWDVYTTITRSEIKEKELEVDKTITRREIEKKELEELMEYRDSNQVQIYKVKIELNEFEKNPKVIFPKSPPEKRLSSNEKFKTVDGKLVNVSGYGRLPKHEFTFKELDTLKDEMKKVHLKAAAKYKYNRKALSEAYDVSNVGKNDSKTGSEALFWQARQDMALRQVPADKKFGKYLKAASKYIEETQAGLDKQDL